MPERLDPGALQATREHLGLSTDALAVILGIRHDTLRRWETGREPIPFRVADEIRDLVDERDNEIALLVDRLIAASNDPAAPPEAITVTVWRTDEAFRQANPAWGEDGRPRTARWWRHIAAAAVQQARAGRIITAR